jgi:transcriptional regulator with XRE-family HTH domain
MSDELLRMPSPTDVRQRALDAQIGDRIKERRRNLGWSRQKLANALSVSHDTILSFESGTAHLSPTSLFEMAQILEVSVAFLFTGRIDPSAEKVSAATQVKAA